MNPSLSNDSPSPSSSSNPSSYLTRIGCGAVSGIITKTSIAPLERMKILIQIQGMKQYCLGLPQYYHSISQSLRFIYRTEGFFGFWKGNGANIVRVIPNYALKFTFNDFFKYLFFKNSNSFSSTQSLSYRNVFLAAFFAASCQISITYPLELVFTRLSLSSILANNMYLKGINHTIYQTVKTEGISGLYKGFSAALVSGIPFICLQLALYDIIQNTLFSYHIKSHPSYQYHINSTNPIKHHTNDKSSTLSSSHSPFYIKLLSGAIAGLLSQTLTYPGDTIRRRMQTDAIGGGSRVYRNIIHAFTTIIKIEGYSGLFSGIRINMIRAIPDAAIQFSLFDLLKNIMKI